MLGVGFNKNRNGPLKLSQEIFEFYFANKESQKEGEVVFLIAKTYTYFTYYSYEIANAIALMFMLRGNNKNRNFCKYILTSSKTIAAHEKNF